MHSFYYNYLVAGPIKQPLEICTLRLDLNNVFNMYNFIYAVIVSIISKNTVYTRVVLVNLDHGY